MATTGWLLRMAAGVAAPGWLVNASWVALAGGTVKLLELTLVTPGRASVAVALSVWAPLVSMRRFVNVATPATAAFATVPWREPAPVWIAAVTVTVESAPLVTALPYASSTVTTGCVPNAEPAVAPAGCVV